MTGKRNFLLLLQLVFWTTEGSWAQRSPFSLQAAVDELHRREAAKYPLNAPPSQQQHYFAGAPEPDYWDEDSSDFPANTNNNNNNNNNKYRNRHRLNKALAKYLERENVDADHGGLSLGPFGGYEFDEDSNNFLSPNYSEEKKRSSSFFRERDNNYDNAPATSFRERESNPSSPSADHAELTEQFLREIEETQEHDREERYKEALRHLWEKYQQQENDVEGDLFEEKKKRMRTPPYYMLMQKKRSSYPVLPWLPYAERKKRFPVAKRSTKRSPSDNNNFNAKTDEKVAKELSELFGTPNDDKKKRSTDEQTQHMTSTQMPPDNTDSTVSNNMRLEIPLKKENSTEAATRTISTAEEHDHQHSHHAGHQGHSLKEHKHRKRSDHRHHSSHESSHEEPEESEEHEHGEEHDEHEDEDEDEDEHDEFEEEEEEERKKKREISVGTVKSPSGEVLKSDQILPGDLSNLRRKKSIQWSKYFGLDRKKKAFKRDNKPELDVKKRSATSDDESDSDSETEKKSRDLDPEKLENMDKKLQSIEDFIIDETIKYTGAHEGIANPDEIRRLKDHVLSRLATAYSLEKMRRALEKLRQSVDNENHLLRNVIESSGGSRRSDDDDESFENQKRLSVKKEKAPLHDNLHLTQSNEKSKELHSNAMMSSLSAPGAHNKNSAGSDDDNDEDVRKKKKRNNHYLRYPDLPNDFTDIDDELGVGYETLNDAYLGNKNYIIGSNQCPLIEAMAERCRGVDLLSGDINQELLPICGVHQICYLCGTSQVSCDYQYLNEADSICGSNVECEAAARSVLMILRGTPGPQVGPRECLKNSCLYSAMREIGL